MAEGRLVAASFLADECPFLAGAVAYQVFFAFVPMLALVVGILGFVSGAEDAERQFVRLLRDIYPSATAAEVRIAHELVAGRALSVGIGLVGTLIGATAVVGSVDTAIAAVLHGGRRRGFVRGRLQGLAFLGGLAVLALLSFALSYGAQAAQSALAAAGLPLVGRLLIAVGAPALGLVAGGLFFLAVYTYVPRVRVPARTARRAALVSAVLWEAAKVGFGVYTGALGAFSAYGPIAFAAGLLAWVYLTAVIILLGAEVMKANTARAELG